MYIYVATYSYSINCSYSIEPLYAMDELGAKILSIVERLSTHGGFISFGPNTGSATLHT